MLMNIFNKPSHQPYLALRAPAQKMIRRKHLPPVEKLQDTITSTSALVSSWAFSESGRQKAGSQIPRGPSIAKFIGEVSDEIKQFQPIVKGKGMSIDELAERATIYRLILSAKADAEDVIALFKDQNAARAFRSRVDMVQEKVDTYEAQKKAYQKAMHEWDRDGNIARYHEGEDFVGLLRDAAVDDRDLWHMVAREIERGVKVDEDALFWVLAQPSCDRATVAAFVKKYTEQGYAAARVGREWKKNSTQFADAFAAVIQRWNEGFYETATLDFSNWDFKATEAAFLKQRKKAHDTLGREPWAVPKDLFKAVVGDTPHPSLYYRHGMGLMELPPRLESYFASIE